jgi:hypothetical protein
MERLNNQVQTHCVCHSARNGREYRGSEHYADITEGGRLWGGTISPGGTRIARSSDVNFDAGPSLT